MIAKWQDFIILRQNDVVEIDMFIVNACSES